MEDSNKRILKNTLFLYVRMFIMMVISFFTTRIILDKLGASDYGVYNVVGGFVSMFTLLNSILQTGTNRFLALSLGKNNKDYSKTTFSTAFVIHLLIAFFVLILLESLGLWFLNTELNIDQERLSAANWVFQFSVVSCVLSIMQTPFTAAITANEKFNIYAYISIFDAILKVLIVYLLVILPWDKLIVYAALMFTSAVITISINLMYCFKKFDECTLSIGYDKSLFWKMVDFSGWSTVGHLSAVLNGQGINVLLNIFFGTVINASRGLANTVTFTVKQFVGGFTTAAVPQLVKYYGSGDTENFTRLIFNISQVTLFMLAIFIVPIMLEIDFVLNLWLTEVPYYTAVFIRISLLLAFLSYSNYMIDQGVNAIGRVKQMNLWSTPLYLLDLPISWAILRLGGDPTTTYWVASIPMVMAMFVNMYILNRYYYFPIRRYVYKIILKNMGLILVASVIPYLVQKNMEPGWVRFFVVCSLSVFCTGLVLWFGGLNSDNRNTIKVKVIGRYKKLTN